MDHLIITQMHGCALGRKRPAGSDIRPQTLRLFWLGLLWLAPFWLGLAHGAVAGNTRFDEQLLLERLEADGAAATYQWLRNTTPTEATAGAYLDWLARFAMARGDYSFAANTLEQLIERDPLHLGARLDLVLALHLEGRSHEARTRLAELNALLIMSHAPLPPEAERQIVDLNRLLEVGVAEEPEPRWFGIVTAAAGYDSNANRAPSEKIERPVLIPGFGSLVFDNALARDDFHTDLGGHIEYGLRPEDCRIRRCLNWMAGVFERRYQEVTDYNQRQMYAGVRHILGGRYQREYSLMARHVQSSQLEFNRVDRQNVLSAEYRQRLPWRPSMVGGVKLELIDDRSVDEDAGWLAAFTLGGLARPWHIGSTPDFARNSQRFRWETGGSWHHRPGYSAGDARRIWGTVIYPLPTKRQWQASASATYQYRFDEYAYFPWVFGSTVRRDHELTVGAQAGRQFGSFQLVARLQYEKVFSSVELFDIDRFLLSLNVAYELF